MEILLESMKYKHHIYFVAWGRPDEMTHHSASVLLGPTLRRVVRRHAGTDTAYVGKYQVTDTETGEVFPEIVLDKGWLTEENWSHEPDEINTPYTDQKP